MSRSIWLRLAFNASWRLAILLLPWQTRLIFTSPTVAGWSWEFGCLSVYASWVPLIFTILLAYLLPGRTVSARFKQYGFFVLSALVLCTLAAGPVSISAGLQWWTQVGLLLGFFFALFRQDVRLKSLEWWVVFGLIPHAVLGMWQVFSQTVFSSTLLGIARQYSTDLGVSVVQTSQFRFLRAYGGFPHPNIFGGWMALGLLFLTDLWMRSAEFRPSRYRSAFFLVAFLFFSAGLFFSFSRSAWFAFTAWFVIFGIFVWRLKKRYLWRRFQQGIALLGIFFLFFGSFFSDLVSVRLGVGEIGRLEQQSVSHRVQGAVSAWDVFWAYPFFGTGPNSDLPALARLHGLDQADAPLEPPHNVFLLVLTSFGVFGFLIFFLFLVLIFQTPPSRSRCRDTSPLSKERFLRFGFNTSSLLKRRNPDKKLSGRWSCDLKIFLFAIAIFPLLFLDHYLWTTWSGQFLAGIALWALLDA